MGISSLFMINKVYAQSACITPPDCATIGYNKASADCPNGSIKCPWDTSKIFCKAEVLPPKPVEDCTGITEVTVPTNASCTEVALRCPSKCTGWTCNSGYISTGLICKTDCSAIQNEYNSCMGNYYSCINRCPSINHPDYKYCDDGCKSTWYGDCMLLQNDLSACNK